MRYTYLGTGMAHRITEFDPEEMTAETWCGLSLVDLQLKPMDTSKPTVDKPYPGEKCQNCNWDEQAGSFGGG